MVSCSFAQAVVTDTKESKQTQLKPQSKNDCAIQPIAHLVNKEGVKSRINTLQQILEGLIPPKQVHLLHSFDSETQRYHENLLNLIVRAGRGHYRWHNMKINADLKSVNEDFLPIPILPLGEKLEFRENEKVKRFQTSWQTKPLVLENSEAMLDPLWAIYSIAMLWEEVTEILTNWGTCLDIRELLSQTDMTNRAPLRLYGCDRASCNRCLDRILRCLSQVLVLPCFHAASIPISNGNYLQAGLNSLSSAKRNKTGENSSLIFIHSRYFTPSLSTHLSQVRFLQPHDSRDLLCGKKDGKVNRIQRDTNTRIILNYPEDSAAISYGQINNHSNRRSYFWIWIERVNAPSEPASPVSVFSTTQSISSTSTFNSPSLWQAWKSLLDELPAECCFHLGGEYHKSLIGVGGANIQKIMKQHGVYVRFLSSQEAPYVLGRDEKEWPGASLSNVLVRTPQRNSEALLSMRKDLQGIVNSSRQNVTFTEKIYTKGDSLPSIDSHWWVLRKGNQLVLLLLANSDLANENNNSLYQNAIKLLNEEESADILSAIPDNLDSISPPPADLSLDGMEDIPKSGHGFYSTMDWLQWDPLEMMRPRSKSLLSYLNKSSAPFLGGEESLKERKNSF